MAVPLSTKHNSLGCTMLTAGRHAQLPSMVFMLCSRMRFHSRTTTCGKKSCSYAKHAQLPSTVFMLYSRRVASSNGRW